MQMGAAADSSSSDNKEIRHSEGTRTYFVSGLVQVVFGPPDLQNGKVAVDIVMRIQFPSNFSYAGVWAQVEDTVELTTFFLNKTSPTVVWGHASASAYLSGSREAFPFDSYATEIKIHIFLGPLNITEPSVYWITPGFMESRPIHRSINSTEYFTDIEIEQAIDRDPRWLLPIIATMIFFPLAILAAIPLARPEDQEASSRGLAAIQPRIFLALTLATGSLTLFEVFRAFAPPAGRAGFFTFPEIISIVAIASGAIYLVMTLVWWSARHGKLVYYDLFSSLCSVAIMLSLLGLLTSYIESYNPPYAIEAFQRSLYSVRVMQVLLAIALVSPAVVQTAGEVYRVRFGAKKAEQTEGEYVC